jgi:hypothetical protein
MLVKEDNKDIFYVYLHRKKSDDKIFYVGKGKGNRYRSKSGRNLHWKNTVKKYGYYSNIIQDSLSEIDSLELEEFLINLIGLENLCNKNYFNGGKSGFKHTLESKEKMSKAKKGHIPWNKGIKCNDSSLRMQGENNPMYGKKVTHAKEVLDKLRRANGTLVCDLYTGIFYDSITEMSNTLCIGRKTNELKKRCFI